MSSAGGVGAGAIGSAAGGLGNVAATVKKQKKRKLRNGLTIHEAEEIWYHGSPELQKLGDQFEGRTLNIRYITDPAKWMAYQNQLTQLERGSKEYMDAINASAELMQYKQVRSPVFLSNKHAVANTYADDRRAFDYQAAEPGVVAVKVKPGNTLVINGQGQSFRGISIASVKEGLANAGISEQDINYALAQHTHDIKGEGGDRMSTNTLASIVDQFGFDIIDVVRIKDNYMGGGPPATVRMVMDPSLIEIQR